MNEIIKLQALMSFLDSFRFGGYSVNYINYYIDMMMDNAEDDLLECLLILKFHGIDNNKDINKHLLIVRDYYNKIKEKNR